MWSSVNVVLVSVCYRDVRVHSQESRLVSVDVITQKTNDEAVAHVWDVTSIAYSFHMCGMVALVYRQLTP